MFSASRVVARLAGYFPPDYSAPTRKEIALADAFRRVLQDASYADVDFEEEDLQVGLDEIEDVEWTPEDDVDECDFDDPLQKTLTCDGHPVTASMLTEALTHYRSTSKKNRSLQSMSNRFRWIRTKVHLKLLRAFEKRNEFRENRVSSLKRLSAALQEKCMDAVEKDPRRAAVLKRRNQTRGNEMRRKIEEDVTLLGAERWSHKNCRKASTTITIGSEEGDPAETREEERHSRATAGRRDTPSPRRRSPDERPKRRTSRDDREKSRRRGSRSRSPREARLSSRDKRERSPRRQIKEEPRSSGEEDTARDHREKKSPRKSSDKSPEHSGSSESDSDDSCDSWKHKMRSTVSVVKR